MRYATIVLWGQKLQIAQNEYGHIDITNQQPATEEDKQEMCYMPQSFSTDRQSLNLNHRGE